MAEAARVPTHEILRAGESRSFPEQHKLLQMGLQAGEVLIVVGAAAGSAFAHDPGRTAILIEIDRECLGVHTGEMAGAEGSNVLGFARYRLGDAPPSDLVELVRQPATRPEAIAAARAVLEGAGLQVAVCMDFAGRIVDRLIRPVFNEALRKLDEGLATAADMDTTMKLGLGYPEGPIERLERTGLAHHHDVTQALFATYGERAYAPARRAVVAKQRQAAARGGL
ncbi:MAG: 3-hydroxyacyl-CoA dehydrogenase [Alphaproteobacteria bacterium]|nr:3-hydroxyacyl-CoA dehydrogenase [Alphaproteobacteria bacterium]